MAMARSRSVRWSEQALAAQVQLRAMVKARLVKKESEQAPPA